MIFLCWVHVLTDTILDILSLGKIHYKIISLISLYFFNVVSRKFRILQKVHILFLLDFAALY